MSTLGERVRSSRTSSSVCCDGPAPSLAVLVYAVVSAETEKAVELFVRRADAETFLEEVRADDAELAELLRLEPVELAA